MNLNMKNFLVIMLVVVIFLVISGYISNHQHINAKMTDDEYLREIVEWYKKGDSLETVSEDFPNMNSEKMLCHLSYDFCGFLVGTDVLERVVNYDLHATGKKTRSRYFEYENLSQNINFYPFIKEDRDNWKKNGLSDREIIIQLNKKYGFKTEVLKMLLQ